MTKTNAIRTTVFAATAIALAICLSACPAAKMPEPLNPEVTQTVMTLSQDLVRDLLLPGIAEAKTGISRDALTASGYPEPTFKAWQASQDQADVISAVVSEIDQRIADLSMQLENVRLDERAPDLKRVACLAQLKLANGNRLDIRYTAQFTETDELYVEVNLLE